jgi:hypothetical protein
VVLVPDLGFVVPAGGGSVSFSDDGNIAEINQSLVLGALAALTNDSAFVGGTDASDHTLIIDINGEEVPPGEGDRAVNSIPLAAVNSIPLAVEEQDGVPAVLAVTKIKVSNGSLTDEGGGTVSLAAGGGGTLTVKEQDSTPTVGSVTELRVPNGSLTDEGGGAVSLDFGTSDYAGKFEGTTIGTGDIPDGKWGWWFDTNVPNRMLHVRNRGGTLYATEANPL